MTILSKRASDRVCVDYRSAWGLQPHWLAADGSFLATDGSPDQAETWGLPVMRKALADAVSEGIRWGEAYIFFLAPGLVAWVVPLVQDLSLRGALLGGPVLSDTESAAGQMTRNYLQAAGCSAGAARDFTKEIPAWSQDRTREAATSLYKLFYQVSGWQPELLHRNRERTLQQQQIAEEIHHRKVRSQRAYPYDEERMLLSLIRVGDKKGARGVLNRLLAAMFIYSPRLPVVRARAIEMMGYLVRAAVEDSPLLESLIEQNQAWMARIAGADDFDILCEALRDALDNFIDSISLQGYNRTSQPVRRAIEYLSAHYAERCTLEAVAEAAGLSTFRTSHLVKEVTGRSVMQHLKRIRVQKAIDLLETTRLTGAEIAAEVGFHDQSHMTREFRGLTGTTPGRYRRERRVPAPSGM